MKLKPGDLVYRPSHLEWGKLEVVSHFLDRDFGALDLTYVKILSQDRTQLVMDGEFVLAEIYESPLYKAVTE